MGVSVSLNTFNTELGIVYSKHASNALDKDHWIVKKEFHYHVGGDTNCLVLVPKGFLTDGASVPRFFWSLIPPWGAYGQAAVLHDYLCENPFYLEYGIKRDLTRKEIDGIFNNAMRELEVNIVTRTVMYRAVRSYSALSKLGDGKSYTRKKSLEKEILNVFNQTNTWI